MLQDAQIAPPAPLAPLAPLAPAQPPAEQIPIVVDGKLGTLGATPSAHDLLMALQAQREELREQVRTLEQKREDITQQIQESRSQGLDITGLEARVKQIDARITAVDQQIDMADQSVAKAAAVPGAVIEEPRQVEVYNGPPEAVWVLSGLFIVAVLMPMAIAMARRIWRRGGGGSAPALPADVNDRLRAIETAVESVAVEVERIGEGQRFMSRLFTDRNGGDARALGEGAAPAVELPQRSRVAESR